VNWTRSKDGTFINEKKLRRGAEERLKPGDQIRFAREKFEFCDAGPEQPSFIDEEQREQGGSPTVPWESGPKTPSPVAGDSVDVDQPCLEVISGTRTSERIRLRDLRSGRTEWKVGSKEELGVGKERNFLVFSEEGVSEEHAKISFQGTHWAVEDLLAKNGTFVNGKRTMLRYLKSGDEIAFGPVVCIFRLPHSKGLRRPGGRWAALSAWMRRLLGGRR